MIVSIIDACRAYAGALNDAQHTQIAARLNRARAFPSVTIQADAEIAATDAEIMASQFVGIVGRFPAANDDAAAPTNLNGEKA